MENSQRNLFEYHERDRPIKKVTFAEKVKLFMDNYSQDVVTNDWMTKDWTRQVEKMSTSQKLAFIDDNGDENFYDSVKDDDDEHFYGSNEILNLHDRVELVLEKEQILHKVGVSKSSGKSSSKKKTSYESF